MKQQPSSRPVLQPMTVLVVEDQYALRQAMVQMLHNVGATHVWEAGSGAQAQLIFNAHQPDLVLLDVILPDCSGLDLLRRIRAAERQADSPAWTPIVLVSSLDDEAAIWDGILAGGDDYLAKPVSPTILAAKMLAMQRLQHTRRQLEVTGAALRQANTLLEQLVEIDPLTELTNRRGLDRILTVELGAALREQKPLSLILCDIDYFKQLNDAAGHVHGDAVLRQVAQLLRSACMRPRDVAVRYGGEEFLLVLPGTPQSGAMTLARGIQHVLAEVAIAHPASPVASHVSLSGGIVTLDHYASEVCQAELLEQADAALYAAKAGGRNRFVHVRDGAQSGRAGHASGEQ
ncbi:hypothetical protein AAV94_06815 [Lampropedia cohaerens]|uniref:diguanylate cyclase n=1 Tax=Lampropedia cohaerens TaxID=1610491 RepID=A0A0U1Q0A4_9BURK|nr:diguanylate cyclase [Lampropedia cohaerens]KKW68166.1 hypothetical protein AAV94_06815 [Lampropedia cohaerens]